MKYLLLLAFLIVTSCPIKSVAQKFTQEFPKWPDKLKPLEKREVPADQDLVIVITKISGNDLDNFLKKSVVKSGDVSIVLGNLVKGGMVKIDTPNKKLEIVTAEILKKEEFEGKVATLDLVRDNVHISIPIQSKKGMAADKEKHGRKEDGGVAGVIDYIFIPRPEMEAKWAGRIYANQTVKLNYHTRWAIVYDFSKEDPVSIYKRLNTVIGNTCDGVVAQVARGKNKNKLSGVLKEINDLDKELTSIQMKTTDSRATIRLNTIKKDFQDLSQQISAATTEEQLEAISKRLDLMKKELDITKALYPMVQQAAVRNNMMPPQCDNIYQIKEVRKLSPTVNRSLLLVIPHYHPYRDSIVLSADYGDRFLQDAALFNSTFPGGASGQEAGKDTGEEPLGEHVEEGDTTMLKEKEPSPLELFTTLRDELKAYADEKIKQENLDIDIVENGVGYIKQQMTARLGITDFSATGILKAAELKSDKMTDEERKEYFTVVHEAVDLFLKVAGYKRYNNHNILIENKDLISLTLNRYRDGKLMTMNKEAVRSYYTAGGVKVDFSVGLFGSSLVDKGFTTKTEWFSDTSYFRNDNGTVDTSRIVAIDSVQRKRIISENNGSFNIGPAVLTHIYWRSGTDVNFSATAGIAINQEAMPRYLFGGSVMFGRDSRWVFSTGVALGPIKDNIAGGYKEGDVVELDELNTISQKDVWKSSWFLSLTFNIGGFNVGGR